MLTVSVHAASRAFLERHKERMGKAVQAIQTTVGTVGLRYVQEEVDRAEPPPVDRGTYRRGWRVQNLSTGAALYNPVKYAPIIEHGRRPGAKQPPTEILRRWVVRKGIAAGAAAKGVAFVIARAISRRGLKGKRILAKARRRLIPEVNRAVREALK